MTREEHHALGRQYWDQAIKAISRYRKTLNPDDWEAYMTNSRLANKHHGIANAMFTRKYGKI